MRLILFLLLSVFFVSCKNAKKIELEVIAFQNIGESSLATKNFQELGKPLKDICKGDDYGFSPFYINRLDINKKIELDYLINKSVDYTKIKAIERDYDKFFRDSIAFKILTEPTNTNFSIDNFLVNVLSKNNYFIFSTDENLKINNAKIFSSIRELRDSITRAICEKSITKVVVLYEPQIQQSNTNTTSIPDTSTTITNATRLVEIKSSNESLRKTLLDISNPKLSFENRKANANNAISKLFTNDFNVIMHEGNSSANQMVWERGDGKKYLVERLTTDDSILGFQIIRADKSQTDTTKYSHIEIVEIHKTN